MSQPFRLLSAASLALLGLACGSEVSRAGLVTSSAAIPPPQTVIDFSQFSGGFTFTAGPVQIGGLVGQDVTWETTTADSVIGDGTYGLADNGFWTAGRDGYTGVNTSTDSMIYRFNDGPVAGVGGFVNYAPGTGTPVIAALGAGDAVLESFNLEAVAPISTPAGTDAGAFRGIVRANADIFALRVTGAFIVLDDLTFSETAIPEPSSAILAGLGLVGAAAFGWTRRRSSRAC